MNIQAFIESIKANFAAEASMQGKYYWSTKASKDALDKAILKATKEAFSNLEEEAVR